MSNSGQESSVRFWPFCDKSASDPKRTFNDDAQGRAGKQAQRRLSAPKVVKQFSIQGFKSVGSTPADFAKFVAQQSAFMNDFARKIESGSK